MKTLDFDTAVRDLREIASEQPDFIYEMGPTGCVYAGDGGAASCIVGHVLKRHLTPEQWEFFVAYENAVTIGAASLRLSAEFGFLEIDPLAVSFLTAVQRMQDRGTPWGAAVEEGVLLMEITKKELVG